MTVADQQVEPNCFGKVCYRSHSAANRVLGIIAKNRRARPRHGFFGPLEVYRCRVCGTWHLGCGQAKVEKR